MVLTLDNCCDYLLLFGFIDKKSIIEGDLLIRDASSRNTNFLVNRFQDKSKNILVKQPDILDEDYIQSMEIEANIYKLIYSEVEFEEIRAFIPEYLKYDEKNHILIMKQLNGVCRIFDYFYYGPFIADSCIIAGFANCLAAMHNIPTEVLKNSSLKEAYPWFLDVSNKDYQKNIKENYPIAYDVMKEVFNNKAWMKTLKKARSSWKNDSFIHLDVRFTNWMISYRHQAGTDSPIWLIDWEMAGIGDPAWDLSFLIGDWISLGHYLKKNYDKKFPKIENKIIQQINIFWHQYCKKRNFNVGEKTELKSRVAQYLLVKFFLILYELLLDYSDDKKAVSDSLEFFKLQMLNADQITEIYFYE